MPHEHSLVTPPEPLLTVRDLTVSGLASATLSSGRGIAWAVGQRRGEALSLAGGEREGARSALRLSGSSSNLPTTPGPLTPPEEVAHTTTYRRSK